MLFKQARYICQQVPWPCMSVIFFCHIILVKSLFCLLECKKSRPLGMQSGRIRNFQITASTSYHRYAPRKARLRSSSGSWWTTLRNRNQWLQVDFRYQATVTSISNQGAHNQNFFVTRYTLSYSNNGLKFRTYKSRGRVKVRLQ